MTNSPILREIVLPLAVLLSYALLVTVVVIRRGLRRHEPVVFVVYLVVATGWLLGVIQEQLRVLLPVVSWERLATYLLLVLGILFWDFTCVFLRKALQIGGWLLGVAAIGALIALDYVIALPPFSLMVGGFILTEKMLTAAHLGAGVTLIYCSIAIATALVEFARQPSPLHRNRIRYWVPGTAALIAGSALVWTRQEGLVIAGIIIHWLGAALLTYLVVQSQLPDIATGIRRLLIYLSATLIPVAIAIALSLGVVYLLGLSPLFRFQLTEEVFFGVIIASAILFGLFQPLNSLTRQWMGRLLFGRGLGPQQVVREYGQAVTQIISLETLATTAMDIIDKALGIQRGALLVVEEARETEWRLRIIEGRGVTAAHPPLTVKAGSLLAKWLVEKGAPLHQYTMDVAPEFESLRAADREEWRRLGMEVFFPVKRSGNLIGLVALGLRRSGRPYTSRDLGLLRVCENNLLSGTFRYR